MENTTSCQELDEKIDQYLANENNFSITLARDQMAPLLYLLSFIFSWESPLERSGLKGVAQEHLSGGNTGGASTANSLYLHRFILPVQGFSPRPSGHKLTYLTFRPDCLK